VRRIALIATALQLLAVPAAAVFNADDPVPAATLLLPYFEVDLADPNGVQTTFTVRNAGPAPVLAHVTLWSTNSSPFLVFDLLLTGFDVQEVRLVDVLQDGPPFNPFCDGKIASSRAVPRGGLPPIVTGFATIDSVSECSNATPDDAGYFVSGGFGIANNENVLWGDYQLIHRAEGVAFGERLVSIEAVETAKPVVRGGGFPLPTFYSVLAATNGADQRERLSPRWGGRYDVSPGARTDVVLWHDVESVACLLRGCIFQRGIIIVPPVRLFALDEDGDFVDVSGATSFLSTSNRVTLDSEDLPIPFDTGWLFLDVSGTTAGPVSAQTTPRGIPLEGQAHLTLLRWSADRTAATASRGVDLRHHHSPGVE